MTQLHLYKRWMPGDLFFLTFLIALEHLRYQNNLEHLAVGVRIQSGSIMSNFEPNAVIRGFQLTVVGSLSPILPCADQGLQT